MQLQEKLEALYSHSFDPLDKVLTVYLNTESDRGKQPEWKIRLKNGMKRLREYTEAEGHAETIKRYDRLQRKVEKAMEERANGMKNGVVIVASASGDFWFMEQVQIPVPNAFYWQEQPHLAEMDQLLALYGPTGILMIGSEEVEVLDSLLGEIRNDWKLTWDVEREDWREYKGLSDSNKEASSASHKEQYTKRFEVNQQRWIRDLCTKLQHAGKKLQWDKVVLTGEEGLTTEVSRELKAGHEHIMKKNLNGRPHHQVLRTIYSELEELHRVAKAT